MCAHSGLMPVSEESCNCFFFLVTKEQIPRKGLHNALHIRVILNLVIILYFEISDHIFVHGDYKTIPFYVFMASFFYLCL